MSDEPTLIPVLSTCMYCASGMCEQCVPTLKDQLGRVTVVCGCAAIEHEDEL